MPRLSSRPEADVAVLVEKALRTQSLGPAVHNFLKSHQNAFLGLFSRQIELIKSRSQDLRDAQITVFDKAMLTLTENPKCLMDPAAVKFFCEEYLNIDLGGPITQMTGTLLQTVQVPEALKQALLSSDDATMIEPETEREIKKPSRPPPFIPGLRKDMEPKLAALWSVYEIARADYLVALDKSNREKTITTAKFLRDTAENILLYLENKNADALMLAELEGTFKHAKTTVVCLTGGKIRKFDKAEIDKVKGVPRGPSRPNHLYSHQYPHPPDTENRYSSAAVSHGLSSSDRPAGYDHRGRTSHSELYPRQDRSPYADQSTRDRRYSYGAITENWEIEIVQKAGRIRQKERLLVSPTTAEKSAAHHRNRQLAEMMWNVIEAETAIIADALGLDHLTADTIVHPFEAEDSHAKPAELMIEFMTEAALVPAMEEPSFQCLDVDTAGFPTVMIARGWSIRIGLLAEGIAVWKT